MMADALGWSLFDFRGTGTWPEAWEPVAYRRVADDHVELRAMPGAAHANSAGTLHGGFLATLAENCLRLPIEHRGQLSVTVSLTLDYPTAARVDQALEGDVRVMRETGRLVFVMIALRQAGEAVVYGTGIIRKLPSQ